MYFSYSKWSEKLHIHINCLHPNTLGTMTLCFFIAFYIFIVYLHLLINCSLYSTSHSFYYLSILSFTNLSISINNVNYISFFFKYSCHANPGADKKGKRIKFKCFNIFASKVSTHIRQ